MLVNTCIAILIKEIYENNNRASFGFIGSETEKEKGISSLTKRMSFYRRILNSYISEDKFNHIIDENKSTYIMINKSCQDVNENLISDLNKYFEENYTIFD